MVLRFAPLFLLLVLAACATTQPTAAPTYPTQEEMEVATPLPPVQVGPNLASPQAIWTLRSALNVAALACDSAIATRYNSLLKRHALLFASAYAAEQERYRAKFGKSWQSRQDKEMTALYNRYANPDGQHLFCETALAVSTDAIRIEEERFGYFAALALDRLNNAPAGSAP